MRRVLGGLTFCYTAVPSVSSIHNVSMRPAPTVGELAKLKAGAGRMPSSGFERFLRNAQVLSFCAAAALLMISSAIYFDWTRDNAVLRRQALEVTRSARNTSDAIAALNHWVYRDGGFAKNQRYYLVRLLGPAPIQILHSGGDCSDKSRLLSAMLYQIGIHSSLVMLYPCPNCSSIHTVVEAAYGKGRMVVDPIWDIEYPAGDGRYYGVRDLAGQALGRDWVMRLKAQSSPSAKIAQMPLDEAAFDYARGMNWDKNTLTRMAATVFQRMDIQPAFLPRPRILEDPQFAVCASLLFSSATLFLIGLAVRGWRSSRYGYPRGQSHKPVPGSR